LEPLLPGRAGNPQKLTSIFLRVSLPFLAAYFASYTYRSINALLGPRLAQEFSLTPAELGFLTASFFCASILAQFPLGFALDRYGPRRVNAALFVFGGIGALLFAAAQSYGALVWGRVLIGFGMSAALIAAMNSFILWYPRERIGILISVVYTVGALGLLAASFPLAWALQVFTWREIFVALAAYTFACCGVLAFVVPERTAAKRQDTLRSLFEGMAVVLRDPGFRRAALVLGANQFTVVSLLSLWMATWLRDIAGYSEGEVAWMLAAMAPAMIAGYLVSGRLSDAAAKRGESGFTVLAVMVAGTLAALLPLALGWAAASIVAWPLFIFFGMGATLTHAIANRRFPAEYAGRINAMLNFCGLLGMFAGQWAVGAVLGLWPQTASGYDPRGYTVALGGQAVVLGAALAWLWSGRALFSTPRT
jgi:MFS family permease